MANSDNVLRGGLTPKHVDARAFPVLDLPPTGTPRSYPASRPTA